MFREQIPPRQLSAWLFAGLTPILTQILCGGSWVWIGIAGAISVALTVCVWRSGWTPTRWQCPVLTIYLIVLLGQLLSYTSQSWPVGNSDPAVPLILLLLGAWSAQKGPSAAARVGAVLFWVVLILYLTVFGAGIKDIQWKWLALKWNLPDKTGLAVLLLPVASVCLLGADRRSGIRLALPAIFTLAAAVVTAGVLSPAVAQNTQNAFYEMSRSVNLLGVARRFEALISASMTVGWFALISLVLSCCGVLAQKIFPGQGRSGVWICATAAAGVKLCGLHISGWILLMTGTVFWVVLPLTTQGLDLRKKS